MVLQLLYQLCPSAASVAPVHAQRACNFKGLFAAEFTFRVAEPPWVLFHHWLTFREHLVLLSSFFLASILLLKSYHFIYLFIFFLCLVNAFHWMCVLILRRRCPSCLECQAFVLRFFLLIRNLRHLLPLSPSRDRGGGISDS